MEEELERTCTELDTAQQCLLIKQSECRQLAAHVSTLRHALNRPLVDAVEHIRRTVHLAIVPDESTLLATKTRASTYQEARHNAQAAVDSLLDLL